MKGSFPLIKDASIHSKLAHLREKQSSSVDAAFIIPGNSQLNLHTGNWHDQAAEYLEHAVSRTPLDLRSGTQRVYLHIKSEDEDALYGALVDLFIALGKAGRPLRQRLLEASREVLDDERFQHLTERLEAGISSTDHILPCRSSILSKGVAGTSHLVIRQATDISQTRDPLQDARDHLEYGQLEEAISVLEAAILEQPQRLELHQDLLEIYRSTNAKESFYNVWGRLDNALNPAVEAWQELANLFTAES